MKLSGLIGFTAMGVSFCAVVSLVTFTTSPPPLDLAAESGAGVSAAAGAIG
jgi:hypothetical protein